MHAVPKANATMRTRQETHGRNEAAGQACCEHMCFTVDIRQVFQKEAFPEMEVSENTPLLINPWEINQAYPPHTCG